MNAVQARNKASNNNSPFSFNALLSQVLLALLCLLCYHGALNGTFVFDDTVAIVKNTVVTSPTNLTALFRHDFWGEPLLSDYSHKSFRPLTTLMFHLEYNKMQLTAEQMKTVNLLLHCLNALLVWHLVRNLPFEHVPAEQVALIAAALFAVHPVHTEAVSGVVGRAELMFCLHFLLALLVTNANMRCSRFADMLVFTLTAMGVLYKETAITIPLGCIFLDFMCKQLNAKSGKDQLRLLCNYRYLGYIVVSAVLIVLRLWWQNFEFPQFKPMDNPIAFNSDLLTKILSQQYLYALNIWLLLCPQWLSFDWALGCVELIKDAWDLRLQAVLALYSFIIVTVTNGKHNFGVLFGLGLLVIPFLPAMGIIKVGFVIAERVLYVPSVGFCFLVGYAYVCCVCRTSSTWLQRLLKWSLILLVLCFLLRTRQRADEWSTEQKLFKSALKVCPNNAKVHYNIARLATDHYDHEKAFHHYHKAIELYPHYESALMNLGNLYRETGDLQSAEMYIKAALVILPEFAAAWMNLGIVQSALKKYTNALGSYENALKYRKRYATCYYNMGNMFLDQKLFSQAMQHWQKAVELNPRQPKAWANILTMLDNRGMHDDAVRLSTTALQYLPNDANITFVRANVFGKMKYYVESEALYKRIIEIEPLNILYHTNLGILYHRWGKTQSAIECYQRALKLNPEMAKSAHENLSKLIRAKNRGRRVDETSHK